MADRKPFFGETTDRDKAFPGIKSLKMTVEQDLWGQRSRNGKPTVRHYTKDSLPRYAKCINPRCQQGGIDLQAMVLWPPDGPSEMKCPGHEGSPQGRRKGAPCDNFFRVKVEIEKAEPPATA